MPTALQDMQPWRRALVEAGLSLSWAAERTGKAVDTVYAYSSGVRRTPPEWEERVLLLVQEYMARKDAA